LSKKIFGFELNGRQVLGFDTGLNARSFAQAKMADCITQHGTVIYPDGTVESWQPGGVTEYIPPEAVGSRSEGTMVIWGTYLPGEELTAIINEEDRKDEALNAIRFWLRAAMVLGKGLNDASLPGPAGAFIVTTNVVTAKNISMEKQYPVGAVFFPPTRLFKRTLDAAGDEALLDAGRFFHPDLSGNELLSFSAGAMLYNIFCGSPPFRRDNQDVLRQDIREGVFVPPNLAKPGFSTELSEIISRAISPVPKKNEIKIRPTPDQIVEILGPPSSKKVSCWIESLSDEETARIRTEQERYGKKRAFTVRTRRFLVRYRVVVAVSLAAFVALLFIIWGVFRRQAERPTTIGMNPVEVAQTYYGAIDDLDSDLMEACVTGRAGRDDINMVVNLFVITRVRQGYEMRDSFMRAQRWIDAGRPVTNDTVFGITDLRINVLSEGETNASLEADYILWIPGAYSDNDSAGENSGQEQSEYVPVPPEGVITRDRLVLVFEKDQWRITAIDRTASSL